MLASFLKKYDKNLLVIIVILTIWGFINFYSISTPLFSKNLTEQYKYLFLFLLKNVILAIFGFIMFSSISWKTLKRISLPLFIIFFLFMLLAFLPGLRPTGQTTARWLDLKIFSFQPTEFLKFTMLLWLAFFLPRLHKEFKLPYERSIVLILILGTVSVFIYLQPTFSNLAIIWASIGAGYLSLKPKAKELLPFVVLIIIFVIISSAYGYRVQRVVDFLYGNGEGKTSYQKTQSRLAIGSGGIIGRGIGNSKIKFIGLPLINSDSVFSVVAEETGFVGSATLIGIFIFLILTVIKNALVTSNSEKKFFVYGVATWISVQAFIHIASNMGIIPTTGVPLPFFSHGFSSQLALMCALGVINNLANS